MAVSTVVQVVACDSGLVSSRTRSIAENRKLVRVILKKEKKLTDVAPYHQTQERDLPSE